MKCVECGRELSSTASCCPNCGCPNEFQKADEILTSTLGDSPAAQNAEETRAVTVKEPPKGREASNRLLEILRIGLAAAAIVCFIISGVFFARGHDVKNNYYNSENYPSLNENAYVGGDAYNYIINGTYFTGYSVIASATFLSGVILVSNTITVTLKLRERE